MAGRQPVKMMPVLRGFARGLGGQDRENLREFRRLRNYYRRNFTGGASDECFIIWCEDMCAQEAGRPSRARLSGLRAEG